MSSSRALPRQRFFANFYHYISCHSPRLHPTPPLPRPLTHSTHHRTFATTHRTSHADSSPHTVPPRATPRNHYQLFPSTFPHGPPPSSPFPIDPRILRTEFLHLQSLTHPDRHHGASRARAEGTSALINRAYQTLLHPLSRAQYLLSLRGIDVEDERATVEDGELLAQVLEIREEMEAAEDEGEVERMRVVNEGRIGESEGVLERAFKEDDLEKAKSEVVRLRFWVNVREGLEGWERGKEVVLQH